MVALAGIVSVMMLASCQKEVEIDGDVDTTTTDRSYSYRLTAEGDVSYIEAEENKNTRKIIAAEDARTVLCAVDAGQISWEVSAYNQTNEKKYKFEASWSGDSNIPMGKESITFSSDIIKYKDAYYWGTVAASNKIEMTNPESSTFTMKGTVPVKKNSTDYRLLTFDLKFTR